MVPSVTTNAWKVFSCERSSADFTLFHEISIPLVAVNGEFSKFVTSSFTAVKS